MSAPFAPGAELPPLAVGPLAPELFARYAAASGDHNPLHTDPAFARAAGLDGVIAHGMLVMGLLGRLADGLAGPGAVRDISVRFRAPTRPGETLRLGGRVTAAYERGGRRLVEAELWARGDGGQLKATGTVTAELGGGARMTIFSVARTERAVTVRFVPIVAWAFVGLAAYGAGQIVARMSAGLTPVGPGPLMALAVLVGFTLFVLYTGGQLVVASFDRAADAVRVSSYGLTGRQVEERRLSDVVGLEVRILRRAQHRVELRLSSGERLPLTRYYIVTLNTRGLQRLAGALGLQPTMIEPPRL